MSSVIDFFSMYFVRNSRCLITSMTGYYYRMITDYTMEVLNMSKESFSDKVKGSVNKAKGEAKDQVGNATDDAKLQSEGKLDKLKGDAQEKMGEVKDAAQKKADEVKDRFSK